MHTCKLQSDIDMFVVCIAICLAVHLLNKHLECVITAWFESRIMTQQGCST